MARQRGSSVISSQRADVARDGSGAGARRAPNPPPFVARLLDPACYPHPVSGVRLLETHISWVLLTGEYAYKIKKPVDLEFVNFTSLEMRRYYCHAELRLNRRLAPALYREVVEIRGTPAAPRIEGEGPLLDYAIRMVEFPQSALAGPALAQGRFGATEIDRLATRIARFHERAPVAPASDRLGAPETVFAAALQNFEQIVALTSRPRELAAVRALRRWTAREFSAVQDELARRKREGWIRECHGDLHLGNIALIDDEPIPFDCIEFNDELRWIDVMNEVAFLMMDLEDRGRGDLAWRFLNRYLEITGYYEGVRVLRFYLVYRALVRAKVHLMRARQAGVPRGTRSRLTAAFEDYIALAQRLSRPQGGGLVITHGLSGCGKTTATLPLVETLGAIRIRSDVERKRLHGIAPLKASGSAPGGGIYSRRASTTTYRKLGELAAVALAAGYPAIVDATFLMRGEREAFRALAASHDAPFVILDFQAPLAVLRERVAQRRTRGGDASEADLKVLERQVAAREPLTPAEMKAAVVVQATHLPSVGMWRPLFDRLKSRRLAPPAAAGPARTRAPARR